MPAHDIDDRMEHERACKVLRANPGMAVWQGWAPVTHACPRAGVVLDLSYDDFGNAVSPGVCFCVGCAGVGVTWVPHWDVPEDLRVRVESGLAAVP